MISWAKAIHIYYPEKKMTRFTSLSKMLSPITVGFACSLTLIILADDTHAELHGSTHSSKTIVLVGPSGVGKSTLGI